MAKDLFQLSIRGDLREHLRAEGRLARRAMTETLREGARDLTQDLRADTGQALGRRVGRKWRFRVYTRRRRTADLAALVYPNGGERLRELLDAHEHGVTIRAQNGRYLAIPTQFNRTGGRRGGRVLFQPEDLQESFVQKSRNGNLIIFAPVRQAQRLNRGQVQTLAFANNRLLGSGRRKATNAAISARAVPMFVLKRSVRIPGGKLETTARVRRIGEGLPARFVATMDKLDRDGGPAAQGGRQRTARR